MLIRLAELTMGRRQVVRQRFLVPSYAGSNPAAPANKSSRLLSAIFIKLCIDLNPMSVAVGSVERGHAQKLASSMI